MHVFVVYILICSDGSFYTGMTSNLDLRIAEHNEGVDSSCYTYSRRPVRLVWSQAFPDETQALARERQIKGWSRAKKQGLIRGDLGGSGSSFQEEASTLPALSLSKRGDVEGSSFDCARAFGPRSAQDVERRENENGLGAARLPKAPKCRG